MRPDLLTRAKLNLAERRSNWRIFQASKQVAYRARPQNQPPVAFFNASTRLSGMSLNAAFAFLSACGLQLAGVPVVYFASRSGMSRCVLGTNRDDYSQPPPCETCIPQAQRLFAHAPTVWFTYKENQPLERALQGLSLQALSDFKYPLAGSKSQEEPVPLGRLVLPSLRWALRRHSLPDDEPTRFLFRQYLLSACSVAAEFVGFLEQVEPAAVVIFNGIMYPEAVARLIARQRGIRAITHEVGFRPFSAFFTDGQATAYPIEIPADFELSAEQDARLDAYLERRFQGQFSMAGIRFWPEMRGLDQDFLQRASRFRQVVPVFTNVVYDTSQVHANTIYPHMFAWLDVVLEIIQAHPETLFVIRAHPDEMRPGTAKQSRQSVQAWVDQHGVRALDNVIFIDSQEYLSSYELIQRSRFVMVYNSSIGLEATLLRKPVLCGGQARYTQYPIVYFPDSPEAYRCRAEEFLSSEGLAETPAEFYRNARRFLYYQLFRTSLPFSEFLEAHPRPGYVQLRPFSWRQLAPGHSATIQTVVDGIVQGKPFLLEE